MRWLLAVGLYRRLPRYAHERDEHVPPVNNGVGGFTAQYQHRLGGWSESRRNVCSKVFGSGTYAGPLYCIDLCSESDVALMLMLRVYCWLHLSTEH